ncbi:DUF6055 domain-containing protein [Crocinitomix sp.]|nr:DUF6055 domain-containing protein [Crocinitomix sp.]
MTRNGYIVWWDNDWDMTTAATELLDSIDSYRVICLTELGMMDPPNPLDGYFYNIYATNPGDYFEPNGWAQGQGTDINGYPFLTLPNLWDLNSVAHEIFHVFQYNATSPGFTYSGDSQWYIEAAANWFAGQINRDHPRGYIEAESLVRLPHVPLWLSYGNMPDEYPSNWQRFVHQYGLSVLLYYLTDFAGVDKEIIIGGLYAGTEESPQEYFYNQIGGELFRKHFMDWTAHMTNDFDFLDEEKRTHNLNEWNTYADADDDNEYTFIYTNEGSGGWVRPADDLITNAWSFNTFKLINSENMTYRFDLRGEAEGTYGDPSFFDARIVVQSESGSTIYDLDMASDLIGDLTLALTPSDTAIFFIVGSMPALFEDSNPSFQKFKYDIKITTGFSTISELDLLNPKLEIARYNVMGQPIDQNYRGVQIILFDDGSTKKIVRLDEF